MPRTPDSRDRIVTGASARRELPAIECDRPSASRVPSLHRMVVFAGILLPFLAATPSFADTFADFRELVRREAPAVVNIEVMQEAPGGTGSSGVVPDRPQGRLPELLRRFFDSDPREPRQEDPGSRDTPAPGRTAFGSGFIISKEGFIVTNSHVVDGASDIRVGLNDRRDYSATLVGSDGASDIAVLKIDAADLPVVRIGDSDELAVGEWVLAIGSPFGLDHTATQGIVSALARSLPDDTYVPFIQTDAAVNPGNSGGPLFNVGGEVIGVNSQIYSRSGGYQGLSFAIPINVAMSIAGQLREQGFATRGWLGVSIQDVDQALAESFGLDRPQGALVAQVTPGGPAAKGGLQRGDVILSFAGNEVDVSSALPPLVGAVTPGDAVAVEVRREGARRTLSVTVEPLAPASANRRRTPAD